MSYSRLLCFVLVLHVCDSREGIEDDIQDPDESDVICSRLVVSNAGYAKCNGEYRIVDVKVEWAPSRPVYKLVSKNRYIFWNKEVDGWSIGNKRGLTTGVIYHHSGLDTKEPWQGVWKREDQAKGVQFECKPELELRGGNTAREGNVYVRNSKNILVPVCDIHWRHIHARIVCRQLGYLDGVHTRKSHFGPVRGDSEWESLSPTCYGAEARIEECKWEKLWWKTCKSDEGAGVMCFDTTGPVILDGGASPSEGNVYALQNKNNYSLIVDSYGVDTLNWENKLGPVCDDNWGNADARVVCRQLGYVDGVATKESHFGSVLDDFAMDNVNCQGDEASLQDCRYSTSDNCYEDEGAGVKCSSVTLDHPDEIIIPEDVVIESGCSSTQFACADGLRCISAGFICDFDKDCADGSDELGTLCLGCNSTEFGCRDWSKCIPAESMCNGGYGCSDGSDDSASTCGGCKPTEYACKERSDECMERSDEFRSICGDCNSTEFVCVNGWQCVEGELKCDGNKDCKDGSDEYPSVCGGCNNSTQFACADGTQCIPAQKRCNRGYPQCKDGSDEFRSICGACNAWEFECANGYQCIAAIFKCDGVKDCFDYSDEFSDFPSQCGSPEVTAAYPTLLNTTKPRSWTSYVELRGGDSVNRGNVYVVNKNKKFGPICDEDWDNIDAQVVCRQLGYKNGIAHTNSRFGPVNPGNAFVMGSVNCGGGKYRIQDCDSLTVWNCLASEGAGVTCYDDYEIIDLVELLGGNSSSEGIAHAANREEEFGPICRDGFGDEEARVVCRQLGFGSGVTTTVPMMDLPYSMGNVIGGGLPSTYPKLGWVGHQFSMGDVVCVGDEDRIQDCQIGQINGRKRIKCPSRKGAGVRCND